MSTNRSLDRAAPRPRRSAVALPLLAVLAAMVTMAAQAAPFSGGDGPRDRGDRGDRGHGREPAPFQRAVPEGRWWDGAHGHGHYYPAPGRVVPVLPPQVRWVPWGGVRYGYVEGVWYSPGPHGYLVVRPPVGVFVTDLPTWRTVVVIGGLAYYYANGVYYRERVEGGYEVVPAPAATTAPVPGTDKLYVYPKLGQSPQQQASDEYECHRWAVAQTGFDPSAAATGQAAADATRRADYGRARIACLEGRGYTVR